MPENTFQADKDKLTKCITSCQTYQQWLGTEKIMDNFVEKHKDVLTESDINEIVDLYYDKGTEISNQ